MDDMKSYTVRVETGEIRLMSQEEVSKLVRTTMARAETGGQTTKKTTKFTRNKATYTAASDLSRRLSLSPRPLASTRPLHFGKTPEELAKSPTSKLFQDFRAAISTGTIPTPSGEASNDNNSCMEDKSKDMKELSRTRDERFSALVRTVGPTAIDPENDPHDVSFTVSTEVDGPKNVSEKELHALVRSSIIRAKFNARHKKHRRKLESTTTASSSNIQGDDLSPIKLLSRKFSWSSVEKSDDEELEDFRDDENVESADFNEVPSGLMDIRQESEVIEQTSIDNQLAVDEMVNAEKNHISSHGSDEIFVTPCSSSKNDVGEGTILNLPVDESDPNNMSIHPDAVSLVLSSGGDTAISDKEICNMVKHSMAKAKLTRQEITDLLEDTPTGVSRTDVASIFEGTMRRTKDSYRSFGVKSLSPRRRRSLGLNISRVEAATILENHPTATTLCENVPADNNDMAMETATTGQGANACEEATDRENKVALTELEATPQHPLSIPSTDEVYDSTTQDLSPICDEDNKLCLLSTASDSAGIVSVDEVYNINTPEWSPNCDEDTKICHLRTASDGAGISSIDKGHDSTTPEWSPNCDEDKKIYNLSTASDDAGGSSTVEVYDPSTPELSPSAFEDKNIVAIQDVDQLLSEESKEVVDDLDADADKCENSETVVLLQQVCDREAQLSPPLVPEEIKQDLQTAPSYREQTNSCCFQVCCMPIILSSSSLEEREESHRAATVLAATTLNQQRQEAITSIPTPEPDIQSSECSVTKIGQTLTETKSPPQNPDNIIDLTEFEPIATTSSADHNEMPHDDCCNDDIASTPLNHTDETKKEPNIVVETVQPSHLGGSELQLQNAVENVVDNDNKACTTVETHAIPLEVKTENSAYDTTVDDSPCMTCFHIPMNATAIPVEDIRDQKSEACGTVDHKCEANQATSNNDIVVPNNNDLVLLASEQEDTDSSTEVLQVHTYKDDFLEDLKSTSKLSRQSKISKYNRLKEHNYDVKSVITDDFLSEVISRKGSKISVSELAKMLQGDATKSSDKALILVGDSEPVTQNNSSDETVLSDRSGMKENNDSSLEATGFCMDFFSIFSDLDLREVDDDFGSSSLYQDDSRDATWVESVLDAESKDEIASSGVTRFFDAQDDMRRKSAGYESEFAASLDENDRRRLTFSFSEGRYTGSMSSSDDY